MAVTRSVVTFVALLAGCIWVGSLVCLAAVAAVARRVLDPLTHVSLFREIGRLYRLIGTGSLLVGCAAGVAIAGRPSTWSPKSEAAIILAGVLCLLTFVAMAQARRMSLLRRQALTADHDSLVTAVRRGSVIAGALRGLMGATTLAIVGLVAGIIGR